MCDSIQIPETPLSGYVLLFIHLLFPPPVVVW